MAVPPERNLFSLEGKTVLITGASGFLGRSMTKAVLAYGANVVALGRSENVEVLTKQWCAEFGKDRVHSYRVDMEDAPRLQSVLKEIVRQEPFIEVIVNNAHEMGPKAGFNVPEGYLETAPMEQWTRHLMGGVAWAALIVQTMGEPMKKKGKGSIINIATMYALVAPSPQLYEGTAFINPPGYSASKAALAAFTRYIASFWGRHGVRANAICPGPFPHLEEGQIPPEHLRAFYERIKSRTCLGRFGRPDELQGAVVFLASAASSYVTGTNLIVDGGWTCI